MTGTICNIQPFSIHDGPGIRTVVFMKGCNLRCFWCHNPESQDRKITISHYPHKCIVCGECSQVCPAAKDGKPAFFTEDCTRCGKCAEECFAEAIVAIGEETTTETLLKRLLKDKNIFLTSGGGVTFSGGEPLLQSDFAAEVMRSCKAEGIHTAVETALCVPWKSVETLIPVCDCFICDLKSADSQKHKEATGAGNELIITNLRKLAALGKLNEVRTPVIPGFNDSPEDICAIRDIVRTFDGEIKYTLLPFHKICEGKYISQGRPFPAAAIPEPTKEQMELLNNLII